jgi:hypothetical protein
LYFNTRAIYLSFDIVSQIHKAIDECVEKNINITRENICSRLPLPGWHSQTVLYNVLMNTLSNMSQSLKKTTKNKLERGLRILCLYKNFGTCLFASTAFNEFIHEYREIVQDPDVLFIRQGIIENCVGEHINQRNKYSFLTMSVKDFVIDDYSRYDLIITGKRTKYTSLLNKLYPDGKLFVIASEYESTNVKGIKFIDSLNIYIQ